MNVPFDRQTAAVYRDELIAWFVGLSAITAGRITDFNVGSNTRSFFESIALRLEHLDLKMFIGLQRAIPTILFEFFGRGDGVTTTTGFPLLPATFASGLVRVTRLAGTTTALLIDAGASFVVPGVGAESRKRYATIGQATLADSAPFVDVFVTALTDGEFGNTPAGTLVMQDTGVAGGNIGLVDQLLTSNQAAFLNGGAAETEEGRRLRFVKFIRNLARAQAAGIEVGALGAQIVTGGTITEKVLFARAARVAEKRGKLDVFVDNGGATASAALVAEVQKITDGFLAPSGERMPGYAAAGIVATAKAVTPLVQNVALTVSLDRGFVFTDMRVTISNAIGAYIFGLGVMKDLVLADLICAVASLRGIADVTITLPTANVTAAAGVRVMVGTITITEALSVAA